MNRLFALGLVGMVAAGLCLLAVGCGRRSAGGVEGARARVESQPSADSWLALGQAYTHAQQYNDAFIAFRQALGYDASNFDALCGLSEASLYLADVQSAAQWANRALERRPDAPAALGLRGRARLASGDTAAALPDLERAASQDSSLLETRLALVAAYRSGRQSDLALNQAAKLAAQFGDQARVHYAYGVLLDERRQWPQAEREYREAVRLDPQMTAAKFALVLVLLNQHKGYDEAQKLAREIDGAAPGDGTAAGLAAWARFLSGQQQQGMRDLLEAYRRHSGNLQIIRWIQAAAVRMGRVDLADAASKTIDQMTKPAPPPPP